MRALNARHGLARNEDTLPKKLYKKMLKEGRTNDLALDETEIAAAIDMYYEQAGQEMKSGIPTRATLEDNELG